MITTNAWLQFDSFKFNQRFNCHYFLAQDDEECNDRNRNGICDEDEEDPEISGGGVLPQEDEDDDVAGGGVLPQDDEDDEVK